MVGRFRGSPRRGAREEIDRVEKEEGGEVYDIYIYIYIQRPLFLSRPSFPPFPQEGEKDGRTAGRVSAAEERQG